MSSLGNPDASITYAREIMSLPKYIRTKQVEDEIVKRVNESEIRSSKQIRDLRAVLKHPQARYLFLEARASLEESKKAMPLHENTKATSLADEIDRFNRAIVSYPWTSLAELKNRQDVISKIKTSREILERIEEFLSNSGGP